MKRKELKGPIWNMLGGGMYAANSVILLMLVSRNLGVDTSGVFSIAFTVAQMLWIFGVFGASHMMMTDYEQEHSFASYRSLKLITSMLMLPLAGLICILMHFDIEKTALTFALTIYMLAHSISELYQSCMFQKNRLDLAGKSQFYRTLLALCCFAIALQLSGSLMLAVLALCGSNVISIWLFSFRPCRSFIPNGERSSYSEVIVLAKACFPVFVSILTMNLLMQMPKLVIELVADNRLQGIFGMIFMPAYAINLLSNFVYQPALKTLGQLIHDKEKDGFALLLYKLCVFTIGATGICAALGWLLGIPVLSWFYGIDLSGYRVELTLVIVGGGTYALCQLMYFVFMLLRKQKIIMHNYVMGVVVSAPVCWCLIQKAGLQGAVISFICTHLLLLLLFIMIMNDILRRTFHV